jgi:hypothetical protein
MRLSLGAGGAVVPKQMPARREALVTESIQSERARSFLRLANPDNGINERIARYETSSLQPDTTDNFFAQFN